jgi:hypothetical protein
MALNDTLSGLVTWIETLPLHQTMQTVDWMVPATQSVHILAIAVVFSSSLVLALRAAHVSGVDWSPARWGQRLNGWVGSGLVVLLLTGILMIVGEPGRSLLNFTFQLKMVLLIAAVAVFLLLSHRLRQLDPPEHATIVERALAGVLVLLWVAIIACGRWIAYS